MIEATHVLDRDICKTCGNPTWLCHTSSNEVEFDILAGWCYAKAELEDFEESPGAPKLEPGEYRYAVAVGVKNETGERDPLPSRNAALAKMASKTLQSN